MSRRPNSVTVASTAALTWSDFDTSQWQAIALPPASRTSRAVASPAARFHSATVTAAPRSAKSLAAALPCPLPAPVIIATLPSSLTGVPPLVRLPAGPRFALVLAYPPLVHREPASGQVGDGDSAVLADLEGRVHQVFGVEEPGGRHVRREREARQRGDGEVEAPADARLQQAAAPDRHAALQAVIVNREAARQPAQ